MPNKLDIDIIFNGISKRIEEDYQKKQKEKNQFSEEKESSTINKADENEVKQLDKLFSLSNESVYEALFNKDIINDKTKNNKNDKSAIINSSKNLISKDNKNEEDKNNNNNNIKLIDITNTIDLEQNIKINDYIKVNSERKNLINYENKSLSLYNSKDNNNFNNNKSITKKSNYANFSLISEVKINEQFDLKVINIQEKNKNALNEETQEKINNNSSSNEKELKLNEILDLMNSSKKVNTYINQNNKIQEDYKENDLTRKDINSSKLSKNLLKIVTINKEENQASEASRYSMLNH